MAIRTTSVAMRMLNLAVSLVLAVCLAFSGTRSAIASDTQDIREVITKQLEAFKRDDGIEAYSYAAPVIRDIFPTADVFIQMVRQGYPQVYRPRSYVFTTMEALGDGYGQIVMITDENGQIWNALYSMQRQPDGSWKISGCQILKDFTTS
jgi:Domain of unknown function (DUF4864)